MNCHAPPYLLTQVLLPTIRTKQMGGRVFILLDVSCIPGIGVDPNAKSLFFRPDLHSMYHILRPNSEVLKEMQEKKCAPTIRPSKRSSGVWHVDEEGSGINTCPCSRPPHFFSSALNVVCTDDDDDDDRTVHFGKRI